MGEVVIVFGLFGAGILAGLFSRHAPLSAIAALALPLVLPPLGIGLAMAFC